MDRDIASVAGASARTTSGHLIGKIAFPVAAAVTLLPFVSPGAALLMGMLLALTVGNPYAVESSRFVSPLLQISVIGLGAGMNLAVVGRVGAHGFVYTVVGITLTMTVGLLLGRLIRTGRDTSILLCVGTAICGGSAARPKGNTTPVVSVAMMNKLRVYVYVPEEAVSQIRRRMPATLSLRGLPGRQFAGSVARFATSLDLFTRTMLTEVDVENPRHELYPGMYANVRIELENHPGALTIPPSAVGGGGDNGTVYVVRNSHLQKVAITTGIRTGGYVEVTSGLAGNEQVVNNFTPALFEGQQVRAELMPQSESDYTANAD